MILSVKTGATIAMIVMFSSSQLAFAQQEVAVPTPGINEQYTMLYYKDMQAPRDFYGGLLGLTSTMDDEWLSLYQVTPTSFIGVIKEAEESWHKVQDTNAVMISIVTDDVDAWYERVLADGSVKIVLEIYDNESVPIRAFMMEDPGGYTVEVFQWVN